MRRVNAIVSLAILMLSFSITWAQINFIPTMINYQGYLTDQGGSPMTGTYQITFALYYDSTATASVVWEEIHTVVNVENGLFNVFLGSIDTLRAADLAGERYLGIRVAGEPEMEPRMRLASNAYSLWAEEANNARTLSASDGDPKGVVFVDTEGNVGVGIDSPSVKLDVNGVINAKNSRPIRQQMVHKRVVFGIAGDASIAYGDAWTNIRFLYGPFSYAIPPVQEGATRRYRLYAIYTDNLTSGNSEVIFECTGGNVTFSLGLTWGGTSGTNRDAYSDWQTTVPSGHGTIRMRTTVAGRTGRVYYLELQAWDFYE